MNTDITMKVLDFIFVDEDHQIFDTIGKTPKRKNFALFLSLDLVDSITENSKASPELSNKKRSRLSPGKQFYKSAQRSDRGSPPSKKYKHHFESHPTIKKDRYKTEPCRSWEELGWCRYGERCQFAHGPEELRNIDRHAKVLFVFLVTIANMS